MFRQTFPGGRNSLIQLTHHFPGCVISRFDLTITIEKPKHLKMYLLLRKKCKVRFYSQLFSSVLTCDFPPQLLRQKLSYKMRITNHQSLGDPKFPVKPCTPESTSRRDPRTSVVRWGLDFNPRGGQPIPRGVPFWVLGFWRGIFTLPVSKSWQDF